MRAGPSLYYASDKNVFDALNQSKVTQETIHGLFLRRNIVCSKETPREELARFFSRMTHDLLDHDDLETRLGITRRQERVTAVDLKGALQDAAIARAINRVKEQLAEYDDVAVVTTTDSGSIVLNVRYTSIDYKRSEFSQVQHREGYVEVIKEAHGLVIRSTKTEHVDGVRDELIRALEHDAKTSLERSEISLFHHKSHHDRNRFFLDLIADLPGYIRTNVTDVYVYKPKPSRENARDDDEGTPDDDIHVERVFLRGDGVSRSEFLRELTRENDYYIVKVGWLATERFGKGSGYDIEATFADPKDCTGFSYVLRNVHELSDDGKLAKNGRRPYTSEIDSVARAIEIKARQLLKDLDQKVNGSKK
jgi:hypothetical protein